MTRRIMLVTHPTRPEVPDLAEEFAERLATHDIEVEVVPEVPPTHEVVGTDRSADIAEFSVHVEHNAHSTSAGQTAMHTLPGATSRDFEVADTARYVGWAIMPEDLESYGVGLACTAPGMENQNTFIRMSRGQLLGEAVRAWVTAIRSWGASSTSSPRSCWSKVTPTYRDVIAAEPSAPITVRAVITSPSARVTPAARPS